MREGVTTNEAAEELGREGLGLGISRGEGRIGPRRGMRSVLSLGGLPRFNYLQSYKDTADGRGTLPRRYCSRQR